MKTVRQNKNTSCAKSGNFGLHLINTWEKLYQKVRIFFFAHLTKERTFLSKFFIEIRSLSIKDTFNIVCDCLNIFNYVKTRVRHIRNCARIGHFPLHDRSNWFLKSNPNNMWPLLFIYVFFFVKKKLLQFKRLACNWTRDIYPVRLSIIFQIG